MLWDYAAEHGFTHFGTSAKYIDSLKKTPIVPARDWQLPKLRSLFSTGSPLVAESYDWVYENIKSDLNLASISGGTDIVSCFALGAATLPVYRGELQCRGLGMAVDIYDELGRPLYREKGELVCLKPFPSMPIGFWNDPDGEKYRQAYFGRFPNIWCHGDYAEVTQHDGVIIYGRSDAVLNPAACASAPPRSTARWKFSRKCWKAWPSARPGRTTSAWCCSSSCAKAFSLTRI